MYVCMLNFLLGSSLFTVKKEVYAVESKDVYNQHQNYENGVKHGTSVYEIVKNVIGCAVASYEEHVIVVDMYNA